MEFIIAVLYLLILIVSEWPTEPDQLLGLFGFTGTVAGATPVPAAEGGPQP